MSKNNYIFDNFVKTQLSTCAPKPLDHLFEKSELSTICL
jgi:hypothetical protein